MDLPQAQTTSVGVASQASQEQVCNWVAACWCTVYITLLVIMPRIM